MALATLPKENDGEAGGCRGDAIGDEVGEWCGFGEDEDLVTCGERNGEQAIGAMAAVGIELAIACDAPGREVAEVEDKESGGGEIERKGEGCGTWEGGGRRWRVVVGAGWKKTEGWVVGF